jgi:hypothetical protein
MPDYPGPTSISPPNDDAGRLLAGNGHGREVVRIVAIDDERQVHFAILPGSVAKNRHLLGRTVA